MNHTPSPDPSDAGIERDIKAAGADKFPRVTLDHIAACIAREYYFTAAQGVDGADIQRQREVDPTRPVHLEPLHLEPDVADTELGPLRLLTFCVLILRNGFTVTGESACASPENFNADTGRAIARAMAVNKIWMLEGYLLKQALYDGA